MKGAKSKGAAKAETKLAVKSKGAEKPAPKGRNTKPAKDPNKPKRAPSAFFVFMDEFPKDKSVAAVGKAAGERWKSLTESDKAPYVAKANKLKGEYNKAIAAYNKGESAAAATKKAAPPAKEEDDDEEESDKSKSEINDDDDDKGSDESAAAATKKAALPAKEEDDDEEESDKSKSEINDDDDDKGTTASTIWTCHAPSPPW